MAVGYGSTISGDWRAVVEVTVSNSANSSTCSVTVRGKCQSFYAYASYMDGWYTNSASGGTTSWSDWFAISAGNTTQFGTATFNVTKGKSSKTFTAKSASRSSSGSTWGQQTSTASASVTIPALESWSVTYNANAPSGAGTVTGMPTGQTKWYGETLKLATGAPALTNYIFKGWNTSANGAGTSYTAGQNYTSNAALTLYAQWELAYVYPTISSASIIRCINESGYPASDEGTYAKLKFGWTFDSHTSSGKWTAKWREVGQTSWTSDKSNQALSSNNGTLAYTLLNKSTFSASTSYQIQLTVTDANGYASTTILILTQGFAHIVLGNGSGHTKSVGIGMAPTASNYLEVGMKERINGNTLYLKSTNVTNNTAPSATTYGNSKIYYHDSGGSIIGIVEPYFTAAGRQGLRIGGYRPISGTNYSNMVFLLNNSDGTPYVTFSTNAKDAWLDALGLSTQSVTFTANSTNWTANTTNVRRSGKVVSVTLTGQAKAGVETWKNDTYTIGTLGVGADAWTEITAVAQISDNFVPILCSVHTDGKIYLRTAGTAIPANTWMWVSGTYITA